MGGMLEQLGGVGILILAVIQWMVNSVAMWVVVNHLVKVEDGAKFTKCMLTTVIITLWAIFLVVVFSIIPIPFGIIIFFVLLIWGSKAIIEGMLEVVEGAFVILIVYFLTGIAIKWALSSLIGL